MGEKKDRISRRTFLKSSAVAGAGITLNLGGVTARSYSKILGANDRVRIGFIGVGNRGSQLLHAFMQFGDVEVAALCDVYEPYLLRDRSRVDKKLIEALGKRIPEMNEELGRGVDRYKDFRRLLEQKNIDAVVIATPDHWHAIQTVTALRAGKDVYVEKPLSMTITEGRKMVLAAFEYKRIVQVGLQRRSSQVYRELANLLKDGRIGKVTLARAYRISNMFPNGIGKESPKEPPKGLDWDMWLGPRPFRPYQDNIAPYKFRWWKLYSSQMANWGVHYIDAVRWMLGEEAPVSVSAHGGKFAVDDDRTIPDTLEVIFEFKSGRLLIFGQYEASGGRAIESGEIELRGTEGNLYANQSGYKIIPSPGGQFQDREPRIEASEVAGIEQDTTADHVRNFLDCVKSRQKPNCDLETGHRSNTFALLANIALETQSRLEWDPDRERIKNNEKANDFLHYPYRRPWSLEI